MSREERARKMREYWDERARLNAAYYVDTRLEYDALDMDMFWEQGELLVKRAMDDGPVKVPNGQTAIEIGSGLGRNVRALGKRFDKAIGCDISKEMLAQSRPEMPANVELVQIDGTSLHPLPDASVDLVMSITVLQHIPDIAVTEGYIRETARVLKPGGFAVVQWNGSAGSAAGWALKRQWLAVTAKLGRRGEKYGREAPEFFGSRIPRPRFLAMVEAAGLLNRGTTGDGTIDSWIWMQKPA